MSRFLKVGGALAVALLLTGAGCGSSPETAPTDTQNAKNAKDTVTLPGTGSTSNSDTMQKTTGDAIIELTAVASGNRQIRFDWEINKGLDEPSHFILLRSTEANPEHDQKTHWFRQLGSKRTATWVNLPAGEQHFRICASNDGETCDVYSDDLTMTVLSGPVEELSVPKDVIDPPKHDESEEETLKDATETFMIDEVPTTDEASTDETEEVTDSAMKVPDDTKTSTDEMVVEPTTDTTNTDSGTDTTEDTSTSTENTTDTSTTTE